MDSKQKVLFIDDETFICSMAEDYFELNGYAIDVFDDSQEALNAFLNNPAQYDIVVTDQTMPNVTGIDLLKKIHEIREDIPRILCTGYSENIEIFNKKETKIDAFFMKPYRFDELIGQIEKLV